jgi:hypothetical protein
MGTGVGAGRSAELPASPAAADDEPVPAEPGASLAPEPPEARLTVAAAAGVPDLAATYALVTRVIGG